MPIFGLLVAMNYRIFIPIIVFSVVSLLNGCSQEPDELSETQTKFELLQGDWVTVKYSHVLGLMQFHLNVEDSIFTLFSGYSDSVHFSLKNNQIVVYDSTDTYYFGNHQKFKIATLDEDDLVLVVQSNKIKKSLKNYGWKSDTLTFRKVQKKNNLKPLKIGFSSSGCFGSCPSMKIEIDEKMNVKFFGSIHSDIEGGYTGKIDEKVYKSIVNQIQNLPLDSLKSEYIAPWSDDQTKYLIIETNDTILRTKAYGTYSQPIELTILMSNLIDLYKRLNLKKNKNIDDVKSFDRFLKVSYPIPLPPTVEE